MKISFCITCKDRFYQISKTLKKNLEDNKSIQNELEFILIDFDSQDGLQNWVIENFKTELSSGYLKYFFTKELKYFDMSMAKNTAHLLAGGDILVNLDCDNFTGKNGAVYVKNQFHKYGSKLLLHQSSGNPGDGSHGRIAMLKKYFNLVGGYDEMFNPMGYQDVDLIQRLIRVGLVYTPKCNSRYNKAIFNTKAQSTRYVNSQKTYMEMCTENLKLSNDNIKSNAIIANKGLGGIKENVFQYTYNSFIEAPISCDYMPKQFAKFGAI